MLLGAAKILKNYESELKGTVKFMFQPSEESLEGAADMISDGLLSDSSIKAAFMIHSITGVPIPSGTLIVASGGVSSPAADYFKITVKGVSCHGSTPQIGVDAISAASHVLLSLQEISARELGVPERAVITIGKFIGGTAGNIIADSVEMEGTLRAYDEETRNFIKKRIEEISIGVASAFRAEAKVKFGSGCPTLINNSSLSDFILSTSRELLGNNNVFSTNELGSNTSGGSEDFAYISQQIPSVMLSISAGDLNNGYKYPQHHPNAIFDESVLSVGASVYAYNAIKFINRF
jgi:hippurate hydrolase